MHNDICLEEIQQGTQGLQTIAAAPTAFYAAPNPPSTLTSSDGLECLLGQLQQKQRSSQQSDKKNNKNYRGNNKGNASSGSGNYEDPGANAGWPSFFNPLTGSIQMWSSLGGLGQ
jgi:hypothetical protein